MVKADTSYDKRVFVIVGGGEFLILFVKKHLLGGKPFKSDGSACFTLWSKSCGMISPGVRTIELLCIILGILEDLSYAHKAGDPFWYL